MKGWSLPKILASLHEDIEHRLKIARKSFAHSGTKGDASEKVWLKLLKTYLPKRYRVASAHVVDSKGTFSEQMDVVVFDRQYSPFIFKFKGKTIVPAEAVYAVFESKQTMDAELIAYARKKVKSVRRLVRTSLPIPHAGRKPYPAKEPQGIIGGLLALDSEWKPALGSSLAKSLRKGGDWGRLDLGCVAAHGFFLHNGESDYVYEVGGKPATAFLLELIARLQAVATVPMIDVRAYARWLAK